jgi:hypothetical protein
MEFDLYAECDVHGTFQHVDWWMYYIKVVNYERMNWERKWHFLKGPCLEIHEPELHHCKKCHEAGRKKSLWGEWFGIKTPMMLIGCCPSCQSAGIIGYPCQNCWEDQYKLLIYPVKDVDSDDYERAMWGPLGPFELTAYYNHSIYVISPPCPIEHAGPFNHDKLIAEISNEDWMFICVVGKTMRNKGMPLFLQASDQMGLQTLKGMEYYNDAKEGYMSWNP